MKQSLAIMRKSPLFIPAMIVPTVIMLIFSFFSLTAPLDSEKVASAFKLGIVNNDTGLTFPPLKVSERMLEGMSANLPFQIVELQEKDGALAALELGDVAAVLVFPPKFSKLVASGDPIELEIFNGNHLTLLETQMSAQLPAMMQANFSAGVLLLRDALSKGQMPDGVFPIVTSVTTLHKAAHPAALVAPFVMTFTTWLASFVGAMLLFLASKTVAHGASMALVRSVLPIAVTGIAAFVLALTIAGTTGAFAMLLSLWATIWAATLAISWLMGGLFAVGGLAALVLVLPVVFYQTSVGGAQAPLAAAPDWLQSIGAVLPFDQLGAMYRAAVHGGGAGVPYDLLGITAVVGLALIWLGSVFLGRAKAE